MLLAASLLQTGALLSQAIEFTGNIFYRPEFDALFEEVGLRMVIDDHITRVLALSIVLPPQALHAMTSVLDERVGHGIGGHELADGGRFFIEPQGEGMLVFYMLLPLSTLGAQFAEGLPKTPRRRRRNRKPRNPEKQLAVKQRKLEDLLVKGQYEEAARLRDEITALQKKSGSE